MMPSVINAAFLSLDSRLISDLPVQFESSYVSFDPKGFLNGEVELPTFSIKYLLTR